MKFINIGSGSKGNCTLISNNKTNILIDCGFGIRRLKNNLDEFGIDLNDIKYIFLTHKHSDHISGLSTVLKYYNIKIYGLPDTLKAVIKYLKDNKVQFDLNNFYPIHAKNFNSEADLINIDNNIKVLPCMSFHDVDCCFYKLYLNDYIFAILTDCGMFNEYIISLLRDVNYLMIECNYDEDVLLHYDKYPIELKNRIKSKNGHLSNIDCSNIIKEIIGTQLKTVCLSHISEHTMKYEENKKEYYKVAIDFVTDRLKNKYKIDLSTTKFIAANQTNNTIILN